MADHSIHTLLSSLKNMLDYCRNIKQLLDNDRNHFGENNIAKVIESNQQKTLMIDKLAALTQAVNAEVVPMGGNVFEAIEMNTGKYNEEQKKELMPLVKELKEELIQAYELLTINSNIVSSNLHHIRTISDKLIELRKKNESLYDHTGSVSV